METDGFFTTGKKRLFFVLYRKLLQLSGDTLHKGDCKRLRTHLVNSIQNDHIQRDIFGLDPIIKDMQAAVIVAEEIGMKRTSILGLVLHGSVRCDTCTSEEVKRGYGGDVAGIIRGLIRINKFYSKSSTIESGNLRSLLLPFAEDIRVIFIMIAGRMSIMRQIKGSRDDEARRQVANEATYLYAPLAYELRLYRLRSELEDLSLRCAEKNAYYRIKGKLSETKASRDKYIAAFITPIQKKLEEAGLHFHIKGRTKSIHSIYQKMKRQKCPFEGMYDLFAIHVILDSEIGKERLECWQAYSIVTDIYQPNLKRLRDWLSVPKSNGCELLHITIMGPEGEWVEVQIRTECMDEIAERSLATHQRYKGIKGGSGLDKWPTSVREAPENSDSSGLETMDQFKLDLYEDEVFIFTPKGDLLKSGKGSTVFDFAFHIHSKLGCKCIGAKVDGRNAQLKRILNSSDQVEIMTSNTQTPKQGWLNIITTFKARTKIRQALKEMAARQHTFAKGTPGRRFKNRKIEYDEGTMTRLIRRLGFKVVTNFYQSIANETLDVNNIIDKYLELQKRGSDTHDDIIYRSAEGYNLQATTLPEETSAKEGMLVIDQNLKGPDFKLARCYNPIYGDGIFGFVAVSGGTRIHRCDYPNASGLRERFGYHIVKARWAGKPQGTQYPITLRIVGHDDIGIATSIISIISKETGVTLWSIGIDSHDGLFSGVLTIMVGNTGRLEVLIEKLRTIKGVKQASRS